MRESSSGVVRQCADGMAQYLQTCNVNSNSIEAVQCCWDNLLITQPAESFAFRLIQFEVSEFISSFQVVSLGTSTNSIGKRQEWKKAKLKNHLFIKLNIKKEIKGLKLICRIVSGVGTGP